MRRVDLTTAGQQDLHRLTLFLDAKSPRAAVAAAEAIRSAILGLADFPDRGKRLPNGRRHLLVRFGDSGYVIQYRVDPDAVVIARISHMRERRPD